MRAGPLRYRLQVEAPTMAPDGMGAPKKTWAPVGFWVYAEISSIGGREYFAQPRDVGAATYRIVIRRIPGVKLDPTMRGRDLDNGTVFDFVAEMPSAKRDYYTFAAVSGRGES